MTRRRSLFAVAALVLLTAGCRGDVATSSSASSVPPRPTPSSVSSLPATTLPESEGGVDLCVSLDAGLVATNLVDAVIVETMQSLPSRIEPWLEVGSWCEVAGPDGSMLIEYGTRADYEIARPGLASTTGYEESSQGFTTESSVGLIVDDEVAIATTDGIDLTDAQVTSILATILGQVDSSLLSGTSTLE